jgi:hypothetical protein
MKDLQTLTLSLLSKTLGKSDAEVSSILFKAGDDGALTDQINDTALEQFETLYAEHLQAAPSDRLKAEFDKGHNAGKFEALSKAEEDMRKAYNLEGKGKLKDLLAEAISKAAKDGSTEDKILTSPLYVSKIAEYEDKIAAIQAESEAKITEATQKSERQMRFNTVLPTLDSALASAGVDTANMKPSAKRAFLAQFEGKDFEVTETGTYIKNADGSLVKDKHSHPIKLEAYVAQDAPNWFDIQKQPGRQSPGNDPTDPPKPTKWTKENVGDLKSFDAVYNTLSGDEAKEYLAAFEAANNPNAPKVLSIT